MSRENQLVKDGRVYSLFVYLKCTKYLTQDSWILNFPVVIECSFNVYILM